MVTETQRKIALVTGGSRGLGRDMAEVMAAQGKDIVITYNSNAEEAQHVVESCQQAGAKAVALQLNVGDIASFAGFSDHLKTALQQTFGAEQVDYLVHNGGYGQTIPFAQATVEDFDGLMNVHLKGPFFLTQTMLPLLADGGGIVNISSGTTRFANPGYSIYASAKSGLETLTRYLAKELGPRGIRANVVAPGAIATDFNNGFVRSRPDFQAMLTANTALGRVGQADDIGSVVAFLCSDAAKWINGQRIEVTGGVML